MINNRIGTIYQLSDIQPTNSYQAINKQLIIEIL